MHAFYSIRFNLKPDLSRSGLYWNKDFIVQKLPRITVYYQHDVIEVKEFVIIILKLTASLIIIVAKPGLSKSGFTKFIFLGNRTRAQYNRILLTTKRFSYEVRLVHLH